MIHITDNAIRPVPDESVWSKTLREPRGTLLPRITAELTDPDFCRALKDSGCAMLKLGLESGDQAVLDQMQKGCDMGNRIKSPERQ